MIYVLTFVDKIEVVMLNTTLENYTNWHIVVNVLIEVNKI